MVKKCRRIIISYIIKSYSGSTTDDMQHFMRPCLSKNPDEIVLHVSTNDITLSTEPLKLANKIISLGLKIKDRSETTKVMISALVQRVGGPIVVVPCD